MYLDLSTEGQKSSSAKTARFGLTLSTRRCQISIIGVAWFPMMRRSAVFGFLARGRYH